MKKLSLLGVILVSFFIIQCGKKDDETADTDADSVSYIMESAMSEAGQHSTSSEGGTSVSSVEFEESDYDLQSIDAIDPQSASVHPMSACSFSSSRSTCSSNVSTVNWGGCSVGTATLTGGWTETWSNGFCANGASPGTLSSGSSVVRTSSSQVLTLASGATLTTDTAAHTAYDGTSIGSTGITVSKSGTTRTIAIDGIHRILKGPRGRTLFNHSLKSTGLTVTGTRALGTRVVSGNLTVYHNIAAYTATNTFNNVTWGNSSCCYPTSGSISTSLSGALTGSTSLAFTSTCGSATFTSTSGSTSTVTLNQCN